jgi:DNA/RNA endonuclease G (NUC1)
MTPQTKNLNRIAWNALEAHVRKWICGEEKLTIITGPVLTGELEKLEAGITIPNKFFKVVYDETPPFKSIAFVYSQSDSGDPYLNRIESVAAVEKMAAIHLPKATSTYPEVKDVAKWKASSKCK